MTDHAEFCLQKTWPLIVQLMATLTLLISTISILPRAQHFRALRRMRLAESLMRRWLVLKACQHLRPQVGRPPFAAPGSGPALPLRPRSDRVRFRLDDPFPSMDIGLTIAPLHGAPDDAAWPQPPAKTSAYQSSFSISEPPAITPQAAARLRRRAQALQDVIDHTERHIARMRRRLRRGFRAYGRPPLRPGSGPGADTRLRRKGEPLQSALFNLDLFAHEALHACGPPAPAHTLY